MPTLTSTNLRSTINKFTESRVIEAGYPYILKTCTATICNKCKFSRVRPKMLQSITGFPLAFPDSLRILITKKRNLCLARDQCPNPQIDTHRRCLQNVEGLVSDPLPPPILLHQFQSIPDTPKNAQT